ncbi:MAG TPA: AAA family ATPase [Acidimicrobiia bacterium]|jgi:class 3 adenylate cyclase|nr:AAA family ATPase [Acidimicrobiia bacterium]
MQGGVAGTGRSTATVLFTDLVGSTALRSRLGEDAAEELRKDHDRLIGSAVDANRGRLVKNLGDGVMATFNGASHAVAAAVAIQQILDRYNRSGRSDAPLEVRIGVSAGDVAFEEADCFGTPVIEAARLCAAAGGGRILVTEVVRALAGTAGGHQFAPVGALELRGLPAPVPACEVTWEPLVGPLLPMPALLTRAGRIFVGRNEELECLLGLWKEANAGDRQLALLAGEPGIGKTRLAVELAGQLRDTGGVVLAGRCDEGLGVPYQPFVEALRHYVSCAPERRLGRYAGDLARLLPELPDLVGGLPEPLRSDPETERYRLFDALTGWLSDVSAEAPVLLVLDDLHWAAKPTLLLLRHVLRSPEPLRLLVVATYRDSEIGRGHPMSDFLAELRRDGGVERVALSGLDAAGVAAFIEAAAGHSLDEEEVQELPSVVWRETEGNPFFVAEVLRHLSESRAIEQRDGRWVLRAGVGELGIPEGVRDVVGRRLSHLAEASNRVLAVAAVVGLEFEPAVVERAGSVGEDELFGALEEASLARLLVEVPGPRYRFSHALVRATLYDELTGARRVALHRRVAEAIESVHSGALDDHLPALAHHWARAAAPAADTARAIDYATRAGDRALTQLAPDEAAAYYGQALELLQVADPAEGQRLRLLIALGEAQRQAGDPAHRETLLSAARLAAERGDAAALARAALANTRPIFSSAVGEVDDDRVASLEAALDAAGDDDAPTRARLLAALGMEIIFAGERERERRMLLADEALAIARRSGDDATLAHVLLQNYFTISTPDTHEKRLAYTEELVALAERLGDPVITARASLYRARSLGEAANVEAADLFLDRAERLAEELGQPTLRWLVGHFRTIRTILAGDLHEGERRVHAGFELGQSTGQPDAAQYPAVHLFIIRFDQGRLGELEARLAERVAAVPGLPTLRAYLALLLCELDRSDEALEHFELLAGDNFTGVPRDPPWILAMPMCAAVCASLGDRARASVLFDLLEPYASQLVFTAGGSLGAVAYYLAMLAATSGNFDEAERRFADAAATHERIGAPTWLARTRLEWARMLINRGRPGDAERARELLGQALTTARERGLANIERRTVQLLER